MGYGITRLIIKIAQAKGLGIIRLTTRITKAPELGTTIPVKELGTIIPVKELGTIIPVKDLGTIRITIRMMELGIKGDGTTREGTLVTVAFAVMVIISISTIDCILLSCVPFKQYMVLSKQVWYYVLCAISNICQSALTICRVDRKRLTCVRTSSETVIPISLLGPANDVVFAPNLAIRVDWLGVLGGCIRKVHLTVCLKSRNWPTSLQLLD